jgi:hypothetical protein
MPDNRTPREEMTRAAEARPVAWQPSNTLPDPHPRPGKKFRWVRTSAGGQSDAINVSRRQREGWIPVKASEYPELQIMCDRDSRFPDSIEVGGLLLCVNTDENVRQRNEYYRTQTVAQMKAVDSQLMAEEDPRLRTMYRKASSRTRFGPESRRDPDRSAQLSSLAKT